MKRLFLYLTTLIFFLLSAVSVEAENNFLGDPHCKAIYNFEPGALTKDSVSSNTLTNVGATENTSNYRQGNGCASFVGGQYTGQLFYITDANLASDHPLKTGDTNKVMSVAQWIYLTAFPEINGMQAISAKWDDTDMGGHMTGLSFKLATHRPVSDTTVQICLGWNGGSAFEKHSHTAPLSLYTWYHVTATYGGDTTKSYSVMIRDVNGNVVGTDLTGTATLDANGLSIVNRDWGVGGQPNPTWNTLVEYGFSGLIDEQVYFNKVLTADDATNIAKGQYGQVSPPPSDTTPPAPPTGVRVQ